MVRRALPQPDTFTLTHMLDIDSNTTQTETKLQVREELILLSKSIVSGTFTELGEILKFWLKELPIFRTL